LFRERKTRFALLSVFAALVVVSTAFAGISIYAQTDDSELTTFEEEAISAGEEFEDSMDNATDDGSTSTAAADLSFLDGLVVCDVGDAEVNGDATEIASFDDSTTPTVSVEVMTETEIAELAANETETASETSTASASCMQMGGDASAPADNATSTAGGNATDADDATPASNATGIDNATDSAMPELGSDASSNDTSTASLPESEDDSEIWVIEGQDFAPGQVVLMFSENALVGIDDVDESGQIEAKVPVPESSGTAIAGNDTGTEIRFVETGTQRTAIFEFDGETLTASEAGDIEAADDGSGEAVTAAPTPSNSTSTNSTSTNSTSTNSTSNATMQ
jgi:hypothetical protein